MKTFDPEDSEAGEAGLDESLRRALDPPPGTAARMIRGALGAVPRPAGSPARRWLPRWLPIPAALVLSLVLVLFLARRRPQHEPPAVNVQERTRAGMK